MTRKTKLKLENTSGIYPHNDLVVLQEIPVRTHVGSLALPDDVVQKEQHAQMQAIFVVCGEIAATHPATKFYRAGDLVLHGRYAGWRHMGKDGKWYRVVRADDVVAGLDVVVEQNTLRGRVPVPLDSSQITVVK